MKTNPIHGLVSLVTSLGDSSGTSLISSVCFAFGICLSSHALAASQSPTYAGPDSVQASFTYRAFVELKTTASQVDEARARQEIDKQVQFRMAPMRLGQAGPKASPSNAYKISNVRIERKAGPENIFRISYQYDGKIILDKAAAQPSGPYNFYLPYYPDEVYKVAAKNGKKSCQDDPFPEDEFWYYWEPKRDDCHLVEGRDYMTVTGQYARIPNTTLTYPEYDRLADPTGTIYVHVLQGPQEDNADDNANGRDWGAKTYQEIRKSLYNHGFEGERWGDYEIRRITGDLKGQKRSAFVEEFTRRGGKTKMIVRMFYGDTHIDGNSAAFHEFLKDAVEHGSVVLYGGHSGLSYFLNLPYIEEMRKFHIDPPKDRYQLFGFMSCATYTYYADMYLQRKATTADPTGTKNLDIVTTGLSPLFGGPEATLVKAVLEAVADYAETGRWTSYQDIVNRGKFDDVFYGVTGDEDNPTAPRR